MELLLSNGRVLLPVQVEYSGKKLALSFSFPYDHALKEEVKCMRGARFVPETKTWEVTDCRRNWMQLESLQVEGTTYRVPAELARYRAPRLGVKPSRTCAMAHQASMLDFGASVRCCIWAAEQGVGKTLSAVELMEWAAKHGFTEWWYVAPLRVLTAVRLELEKWKCEVKPRLLNYDVLARELEDKFTCRSCGQRDVPERSTWTRAKAIRHGNGCAGGRDESGKCVTCGWYEGQVESAKPRCKACGAEADHINLWRKQPRAPAPHGAIFDESSRLKNGGSDRTKAAQELADRIREEHDGFVIEMTGTPAPHDPGDWHSQAEIVLPGLLRESTRAHLERRCAIIEKQDLGDGRAFPKIIEWRKDEVEFLYERLKPVTEIHMAKDVLELPELIKEIIRLPVSEDIERAARLAVQSSINAAQALNRLRQLSDGFQYGGSHACSDCDGIGGLTADSQWVECHACGGGGFVLSPDGVRSAPGPKEDRLREDLGLNEEVGRLVVYAGYHASVDLCTLVAGEEGWAVLQCDGRGWKWFTPNGSDEHWDEVELLREMDLGTRSNILDKLCLVGHPKSVGLGQNLTAARENVFFSNDFDAESRWQAEKRSHRNGQTRAVRIKDYCHLPTDEFVLRNLEKKRTLQSVTLGEVLACL